MIIDVPVIILVHLLGEKLAHSHGSKFMYNTFMGFEPRIRGHGTDVYQLFFRWSKVFDVCWLSVYANRIDWLAHTSKNRTFSNPHTTKEEARGKKSQKKKKKGRSRVAKWLYFCLILSFHLVFIFRARIYCSKVGMINRDHIVFLFIRKWTDTRLRPISIFFPCLLLNYVMLFLKHPLYCLGYKSFQVCGVS